MRDFCQESKSLFFLCERHACIIARHTQAAGLITCRSSVSPLFLQLYGLWISNVILQIHVNEPRFNFCFREQYRMTLKSHLLRKKMKYILMMCSLHESFADTLWFCLWSNLRWQHRTEQQTFNSYSLPFLKVSPRQTSLFLLRKREYYKFKYFSS